MRIDIMEYKPKKNILKIIAIFILSIILIALFSVLGIKCAKEYKNNIKEDKKQQLQLKEENKKNENKEQNVSKDKNENSNNKKENRDKLNISDIYKKDSKIAYLTFDDGPSQVVTPLILDVLKEEQIKATFFVLGYNAKKNPEILKRAYEEGHYIANHGYSHDYAKIYKNAKSVLEEYNKTEKAIKEAIKNNEYSSNLFRFTGGYDGGKYANIKKEAAKLLKQNNILYIDWNVLTKDAQGANTKEKIINNIKKQTKDKGNIVVLMHDSSSKILTYETLKDVIKYLRNEGYTFENFYSIMQ